MYLGKGGNPKYISATSSHKFYFATELMTAIKGNFVNVVNPGWDC
jgi:hypothetical protein